ncbi:MAG: hypothetical protein P8Q92_15580 [Pseudoprimorskyibacter sp.]|nr:hypothetical protein [Pseudoprimorskyibacter sp.]
MIKFLLVRSIYSNQVGKSLNTSDGNHCPLSPRAAFSIGSGRTANLDAANIRTLIYAGAKRALLGLACTALHLQSSAKLQT